MKIYFLIFLWQKLLAVRWLPEEEMLTSFTIVQDHLANPMNRTSTAYTWWHPQWAIITDHLPPIGEKINYLEPQDSKPFH